MSTRWRVTAVDNRATIRKLKRSCVLANDLDKKKNVEESVSNYLILGHNYVYEQKFIGK